MSEDWCARYFKSLGPAALIRQYAVHSYLYYMRGETVVGDCYYDRLARHIASRFDEIKPHDNNNYIWPSAAESCSGFDEATRVHGETKRLAELVLHVWQGDKYADYAAIEDDALMLMEREGDSDE